jgi:NAD(P)-dependent dehydrogenase (short-subunit alcohol dehydrogenase family)
MSENYLEGKTALVTGSSRNLGAAIARELAARGARLVVTYHRSRPAAEALVAEMRNVAGVDHLLVGGDVATGAGARALAEEAVSEAGGIDVLVNNAGPFSMDPFAKLAMEEWDRILDANLKAAYVCSQVVVPGMRQAGWGRIVNVSAGSAYIRNHSIYTLAKTALVTLTEELALELGPEITVNAIAPGQISESAADIAEVDPTFVERSIHWTPLKRLVTRPEVAAIVAELCGPRFAMVTGATIPIDGGWRLSRF